MPLDKRDIPRLAEEYASKSPQQILQLAMEHYDDLWVSFSGADDIVVSARCAK